jgi:hypothetical protein
MLKELISQSNTGKEVHNTLVFVHAHWCPYTVAFYKTCEALTVAMKKKLPFIKTVTIDDKSISYIKENYSSLYKKLADYYVVRDDYGRKQGEYKIYFPTIVFFVDGARIKYDGEREVEEMMSFLDSHADKPQRFQRTPKISRSPNTPKTPKTPIATRTPIKEMSAGNTKKKVEKQEKAASKTVKPVAKREPVAKLSKAKLSSKQLDKPKSKNNASLQSEIDKAFRRLFK